VAATLETAKTYVFAGMVIHNPKVGGSIPPPATNSSNHFKDLHLSRDGLILLLDGPVGSRTREQVFIDCCALRSTFTSSATWTHIESRNCRRTSWYGRGSLRIRVGNFAAMPAVVVSTMPLYNRVKSIDGTLTCRNPNCGSLLVCDGDDL